LALEADLEELTQIHHELMAEGNK